MAGHNSHGIWGRAKSHHSLRTPSQLTGMSTLSDMVAMNSHVIQCKAFSDGEKSRVLDTRVKPPLNEASVY